MWGFLTCLNDILVPHLKSIFDLNYAQVMLVQFVFFSAYFLFSVPWSSIVNTVGYQRTMVVGLLTMAVGASLFVPAASAASYPLFLTALLILAGGITGLQVAANPYVDLLGKPETASSRLDLTQAFNSLGTTIAPKIGGLLILSAAPLAVEQLRQLGPEALHAYRVQQGASVKMPYAVITVALILLAIMIGMFKLPKIETAHQRSGEAVNDSVWKHRNLVLGAIGIFSYVGAEVSIGSFLVNYFGMPEIASLPAKTAAGFVLLGRSHGRALSGRATTSPGQARTSVGSMRDRGGHTRDGFHAGWRPRGDVEHSRCRVLQLDHVPDNLQPGSSRTRSFDRNRVRHPEHGHRRWCNPAGHTGRNRRPRRASPRFLSACDLLLVHFILWT
jgi:MFS transporter, FHS family, L-fucose permease